MLAVEVKQLKKVYQFGEQEINALNGINFAVKKGEIVAVTGESGSGKSTLLHILGTLDSPSSGEIFVDYKNPFSKNDKLVSSFRNLHIGFIFQHNNLLPEFNALENVMMPGLIAGKKNKIVKEKAENLLETVGLTKRLKHYPGQLSGGEQQRVAIARALINDPVLVLADEPSGNLDSKNAYLIHDLFKEINKKYQSTILVVTHNNEFADSLPRRIRLRDGIVLSDDKSQI
ncbi:ABC transporter ATP-binding protein [Pigmentibacter sp. JX0631]|uniref:ABC transporter ATP-binding protein n=1 Tax=Pigmentibacter sp. JX0631 TaxID=2976982 RepID=UPI002468BC43|nr:ABC transporter ATP-binding protein [Pigmentibacter sp. JX0631]WGL61157.1 ABC transporter ATP-binding protein [Pigmentibacter sp. JX0631]